MIGVLLGLIMYVLTFTLFHSADLLYICRCRFTLYFIVRYRSFCMSGAIFVFEADEEYLCSKQMRAGGQKNEMQELIRKDCQFMFHSGHLAFLFRRQI